MRYVRHISSKKTPPNAPIPGEDQVVNSAGGYVYGLDKWARLRRFLILGSEKNTYYATEQELTRENAKSAIECIREDGSRVVNEIVEISFSGRAPKNDSAVFALALCLAFGDDEAKRLVCEALPKVCRTGTHLFHFADAVNEIRGWGKMLRKAISEWYSSKQPRELALQVVKYKQRDGWSHRDLLRLAHVSPADALHNSIYNWIAKDRTDACALAGTEAELIWASKEAALAEKPELIELIRKYNLPREAVPTRFLSDPGVWDAMLPSMGLTAIIRNLANMSRCGLVEAGMSDAVKFITGRIADDRQLTRARIHPIQVLSALKTYSSGRGVRSKGARWSPNKHIVDALDDAFYKAFGCIDPTGHRYMLALDVSGSMNSGEIAGVPGLSPRVASAALAMVGQSVEKDTQCVAFSGGCGDFRRERGDLRESSIVPIDISNKRRLDDVVKYLRSFPFFGTDCALPMLYAMAREIIVDAFVVYTDSETWAGGIHPSQALRAYREKYNPNAKLIVVGMVSNGFSIADPNDPGMLDIIGFDTAAPALMADFVRGAV